MSLTPTYLLTFFAMVSEQPHLQHLGDTKLVHHQMSVRQYNASDHIQVQVEIPSVQERVFLQPLPQHLASTTLGLPDATLYGRSRSLNENYSLIRLLI